MKESNTKDTKDGGRWVVARPGRVIPGLPRPSPSEPADQAQGTIGTPATVRSEFYEAYKRQAKIFDKELKEYNKELNVTLLFVSDPRAQTELG